MVGIPPASSASAAAGLAATCLPGAASAAAASALSSPPAAAAQRGVRIKRVVSCFLVSATTPPPTPSSCTLPSSTAPPLPEGDVSVDPSRPHRLHDDDRQRVRIAAFRRQPTMPTFPGCWAPCSGSVEEGESPRQAAVRELREETNALEGVAADGGEDEGGECEGDKPDENVAVRRSLSSAVSPYGLYVDVPFPSAATNAGAEANAAGDGSGRPSGIVRVYPFAVDVPPGFELEMRGTEHDRFRWVTAPELERLDPAVPALALAFHRATRGRYYRCRVGDLARAREAAAREWASDTSSGASAMARGALRLLLGLDYPRRREEAEDLAGLLMMMRPAMVAITVAMRRFLALSGKLDAAAAAAPSGSGPHPARQVLEELDRESRRSVEAAAEAARRALGARGRRRGGGASSADEATDSARPTAHVVVFSRSSTLVSVLKALGSDYGLRVTCSRSAPGGEGELMAQDVQNALGGFGIGETSVRVEDDAALLDPAWWLRNPVQLVLVGADCVMGGAAGAVYNKVGTRALAEAAAGACRVPVICCGDAFKAWDDAFPPPLEEVFEPVPRELFAEVVA